MRDGSSLLVWDNHGCMPVAPLRPEFLPQLERYRASGVDVAFINAGFGELSIEDHIRSIATFRRWLMDHTDRFSLIGAAGDILRAKAEGKLAVGFDIEGMAPLNGGDLSLVSLFYDLGVRWMSVAYNRNNRVGGGCHDEDQGLTPFGREVLAEMKRVGMVVCCSHTGLKTCLDVFEHADNPVIFSHSNAAAVYAHGRNIGDEAIRLCAQTGGVVGLNGIGIFLGRNDNSTDAFVRHIEHVVNLVGPNHAGLGLDYVFDQSEMDSVVEKMRKTFPDASYQKGIRMIEPERIPEILDRLRRLGWAEEDVRKIAGGNFLRVARRVWKSSSSVCESVT